MKHWMIAALLALLSAGAGPVAAMGFCPPSNPMSMREEVALADVVMYGTLANPRVETDANEKLEFTDFHIQRVIKAGPFVGGTKVLQLSRYVAVEPKKDQFLIFFAAAKGKLEEYRGIPVAASAAIDYLQEMLSVDPTDRIALLTQSLRYLDHADPAIADDAFLEFSRAAEALAGASEADYRPLAVCLSADRLAGLLIDPQSSPHKQELYARLLGQVGNVKHAPLLRCMFDLPDGPDAAAKRRVGLLVGFTLLQPREGWAYLDALLGDSSQDFPDRYRALRAIRYLWEVRPDVLSRKDLLNGISRLLEQSDIADIAIEDLRKWGQWQMADQVMALTDKPSHNTIPIVRRALLRFALGCPNNAAAGKYVEKLRRENPTMVEEAEELLRLENAKD
jgi:hypothetical protein